jgi:hypothetical protein
MESGEDWSGLEPVAGNIKLLEEATPPRARHGQEEDEEGLELATGAQVQM